MTAQVHPALLGLLSDDVLQKLCRDLDDQGLAAFAQVSTEVKSSCKEELRRRHEALLAEVEDYRNKLEEDSFEGLIGTLREMQDLPAWRLRHNVTAVLKLLNEDFYNYFGDTPRVWEVRKAALETLEKLSPDVLARHVDAVLQCLNEEFSYSDVRIAALKTLQKLSPEVLSQNVVVQAVIDQMDDDYTEMDRNGPDGYNGEGLRKAALETLEKLSPDVLARPVVVHAVIDQMIDEYNSGAVRKAARETLEKLSPDWHSIALETLVGTGVL